MGCTQSRNKSPAAKQPITLIVCDNAFHITEVVDLLRLREETRESTDRFDCIVRAIPDQQSIPAPLIIGRVVLITNTGLVDAITHCKHFFEYIRHECCKRNYQIVDVLYASLSSIAQMTVPYAKQQLNGKYFANISSTDAAAMRDWESAVRSRQLDAASRRNVE